MPWTVGDVDKHKAGLTSEQKKKWVKVANGVYNQCMKDGGTDKTCSGKAIRIANSKFSEDSMKVPKVALQFVDGEGFAKAAEGDNNVDILIYSGKVIKNHWWWGDLVIDIQGGRFSKKFFPILEQHDIARKIGFSSKPNTENNQISLHKITFVSTPTSEEFIKLSKEGFPYQTSISIKPTIIEELADDVSAEVNGFTFKGPGTIFRQWEYRECSVCVFGYDDKTHAKAFSEDVEEIEIEIDRKEQSTEEFSEINGKEEVEEIMTLKELKEKDQEGYAKLMADAEQAVKETFAEEKEGMEAKVTALTERLEKTEEANKQLQKENTIRAERERTQLVKEIWATKLAASDIPERIHQKVASLVNAEKFITNDEFDIEAFSKAVDQEIADFEAAGIKTTVIGSGSTARTATEETEQVAKLAEDKKWVENMRTLAGQPIN